MKPHLSLCALTFCCLLPNLCTLARPDLIVIPFQSYDGLIVFRGTVEYQTGHMVLDTGIPETIVNRRHFKQLRPYKVAGYDGVQSINGTVQEIGQSLVSLQLGDLRANVVANVMDLQAIEEQKGIEILAMVGLELFWKFELVIDYFAQEILLYELDRTGNRIVQEPAPLPRRTLPFRYEKHLPCIAAELHGTYLSLGLDTGAGFNVLASTIFEKAADQFENVHPKKMMNLHGEQITVFTARTGRLSIGDIETPPMSTLFVPMNTHYGSLDGKNIHGLLGAEFFRHFRTAINFKKREVYLWDAQSLENAPLARTGLSKN